MEFKGDKRKKKNKKQEASVKRPMIVIPYVEKVSEAIVRIMKKHNVPVAMKPWKTLKDLLVHPKDKQDKEDTIECVYCDETYVGETGRKLGVRLHALALVYHECEMGGGPTQSRTRVSDPSLCCLGC